MTPTRAELVQRLIALDPQHRLTMAAKRLGVGQPRMSAISRGSRLSIGNCLKLADVTGEPPHVVLRTYGYAAEADILERAYPKQGRTAKTDAEMLDGVQRMSHQHQRLARALVAALAPKKRTRKAR